MNCLKEAKTENQQLRKELDIATKKIDNLKRYSKRHNRTSALFLRGSHGFALSGIACLSPVSLPPPSLLLTRSRLSSNLLLIRSTCRSPQVTFLLRIVSRENPDQVPPAVQRVRRLLYVLPTSRDVMLCMLPGGC